MQAHRIIQNGSHDGQGCRCLLGRKRRRRIDRHDHVGVQSHQLVREARQSRDIRVGVARDNVNVPSVGVPDLAQAVQEGGRQGCKPGVRSGYQIAEYRARAPIGLLRARRERPRRGAAEQRYELASSQVEHGASSPALGSRRQQ
jgi:hypothetical protein